MYLLMLFLILVTGMVLQKIVKIWMRKAMAWVKQKYGKKKVVVAKTNGERRIKRS